jgi:hypothetical protein
MVVVVWHYTPIIVVLLFLGGGGEGRRGVWVVGCVFSRGVCQDGKKTMEDSNNKLIYYLGQ